MSRDIEPGVFSMMTMVLLLVGGLALLILGGELLVRGSVRVAEAMGLSPLLIGLTLVGFGTSMPELVTSVEAARIGSPGIAVGNVVGSNIANILLILGISAALTPMVIDTRALARDGMLVLLSGALLWLAGAIGVIDLLVGTIFIVLLVAYVAFAYGMERTVAIEGGDHGAAFDRALAIQSLDPALAASAQRKRVAELILALVTALAGLALILLGGRFLVDGAVDLARVAGLSEAVIGLTIVAIGTSAPELATSIVAAVRGRSDLAFGNVLGSNIYNTLGIIGATGLIAPTTIPDQIQRIDLPVMLGASLLLLLVAATGRRISRSEGLLLLLLYIGYLAAQFVLPTVAS